MNIFRLTTENVSALNTEKYAELVSFLSDTVPSDIRSSLATILASQHMAIYLAGGLDDPVGTITLIIEPKIIHNGRPVGHVEDLVVHHEHRGRGLARLLVNTVVSEAQRRHCYKVLLNCDDDHMPLYEKLGFTRRTHGMRLDLK
jgi:glucosamine-phosphate N-acetyltransferase